MKKFLRSTVLFLIVTTLYGCGDKDPYRVAYVAGMTGRVADLGIAGRNGATLAIEEWNSQGGIDNRKIVLDVYDDQQDTNAIETIVNKIVASSAIAIIGPMTSSMALPLVEGTREAGIAIISPTVTTRDLSMKEDHFFRVISDTSTSAIDMARHRVLGLGKKSISIVIDQSNSSYTQSWSDDFKKEAIRLGADIVSEHNYNSSADIHFSRIASSALQPGPDLVQLVASALDTANITQQIRKLDDSVTISATEWAATERLLEMGGSAIEGLYLSQFFDRNSNNPDYKDFNGRFVKRFGYRPGFPEINAYDAAKIILTVIERKDPDRSQFAKQLSNIGEFKGSFRKLRFDKYGEADSRTYQAVISDSKFLSLTE